MVDLVADVVFPDGIDWEPPVLRYVDIPQPTEDAALCCDTSSESLSCDESFSSELHAGRGDCGATRNSHERGLLAVSVLVSVLVLREFFSVCVRFAVALRSFDEETCKMLYWMMEADATHARWGVPMQTLLLIVPCLSRWRRTCRLRLACSLR
jgi:hypothetical protein